MAFVENQILALTFKQKSNLALVFVGTIKNGKFTGMKLRKLTLEDGKVASNEAAPKGLSSKVFKSSLKRAKRENEWYWSVTPSDTPFTIKLSNSKFKCIRHVEGKVVSVKSVKIDYNIVTSSINYFIISTYRHDKNSDPIEHIDKIKCSPEFINSLRNFFL